MVSPSSRGDVVSYPYTITEELVEVACGGVRDGAEDAGDA
jgi:hypothetical protein